MLHYSIAELSAIHCEEEINDRIDFLMSGDTEPDEAVVQQQRIDTGQNAKDDQKEPRREEQATRMQQNGNEKAGHECMARCGATNSAYLDNPARQPKPQPVIIR